MNRYQVFMTLGFFTLVSCSSFEDVPMPPQQAPPRAIMQNIPGQYVKPAALANLRYGENVKGYTFGRYVDPQDPSVMYEQNIVYRLEEQSSWNLQPNLPVRVPYEGSQRRLLNDDDRHLRAEMEVKAHEERKYYAFLKASVEEVKKNRTILAHTMHISKKMAVQNKTLLSKLQTLTETNIAYKKKLLQQQVQLEKLVQAYAQREEERIKSISKYKRH